MQNPHAIVSPKYVRRLYSDLPVITKVHHRKLTYLQCRLDTVADMNVTPANICKQLYHDYRLTKHDQYSVTLMFRDLLV